MIVPDPKKRPKSSYIRFEADVPNECWHPDFTHFRLAATTLEQLQAQLDAFVT
ncbi:hypothetical protein ACFSBG_15280 [Georgenia yuyongxinii]|uniref:hypothetical protein n=1 Tax=Georgenia yuyongxinii TaxID=2589797 RepID=UPI00143D71A9|nr:hypothetical protein [Georgenia yuyongxinii]